jgi:hypothetical protein
MSSSRPEEWGNCPIGRTGSFQIRISSKGAVTEEDYSNSLIKKAQINFRPGALLAGMLTDLTFAKVAVKYTKDEEEEGGEFTS